MVQYSTSVDRAFAALGDPTRRAVLERLGGGSATISELAEPFGMSLTGMKKHIRLLEEAELVTTQKVGRARRCMLAPYAFEGISTWLQRLDRFAQVVERTKGAPMSTTVTTPNELEIRVERLFDAPRTHVYSVWTDPELIPEWWGDGTVVEEMDVRPGGTYRFRTAFGVVEGEFREVEPPERLVQTFQNHLQTLEFEDLGEQTKLTQTMRFETTEQRDTTMQYGVEEGAKAGLRSRRRAAGEDQRRGTSMTKDSAQQAESPAQLIDAKIEELGDWRGETLSRLRGLIKQADPEVVEEWKWRRRRIQGFRCGLTTAGSAPARRTRAS
jgi:uncharacterized protein YndB with AHSA1/START domain